MTTFKQSDPIDFGILDLNRYGVDFEFFGDPVQSHLSEQHDAEIIEWIFSE